MSSMGVPTKRPISRRRPRWSAGTLISVTVAVLPARREASGCVSAGMALRHLKRGGNGLDEDGFGQLPAQSQPRVADLADHIDVCADERDLLFLNQPHLAQSLRD